MKTKVLMWVAASTMVLTLSQPASADPGRTVVDTFEFYAIGHGDAGGACFNDPEPTDPPQTAAFQSCTSVFPPGDATHVGITVVDTADQAVYFTVQQDNNPNFAWGCGTLSGGDLSADGLYPLSGWGTVYVFPWAGPGINNVLDPGGALCTGSVDTNIIKPGEEGTVTFTFHNHVA